MALISKKKMGFLNGSIPKPIFTDPLYPYWERCNTLLMLWLLNSLSPSIAQSVIFFETAIDIWTDLRERFSQGDLLRVVELQEEIYSLKQGSNNVTNYYTNLESLWEELDNFRPLLPCSYSAKTFHQQDFIIQFVKGLDDRFSMVRSKILLLDPLPSTNRVFSMIIQHECQHIGSVISDINPFVNVMTGKNRGIPHLGGSKANKKCHTVDVCYGRYGYPPRHPKYPSRPHPPNKNQSNHGGAVNSAVGEGNKTTTYGGDNPKETGVVSVNENGLNITEAQYQQLIAFLQANPGLGGANSNDMPIWANLYFSNPNYFSHTIYDHIVCSLDYFHTYSKIKPMNINLPNGTFVKAQIYGSIHFSPSFAIHNVLYVPDFTFNLLSISKLLSTLEYVITFSNDS
uniref:Retrovirus-related Pol polyprotein from transposon TNT 1-94-like beta-barrel domain-containing protein n=1 Tax=Cajanus cajan TaxID=3821 RepID=A0A151RIC0_CAJCA|nr:hypothetical protein KK1_036235 [Cajanus cajan]